MKNVVIALMLCVASVASAAEQKLGVVDLQRALQSVDEGKKAKAALEKEFNDKRKSLQSEEESLKKATEDFKKQSMVLSEDARRRKEGELQERYMKYREMFGKAQFDIQNRERELTEPIIVKLRGVVNKIGEKDKYSMIFEKSDNTVLYHLKNDDITDRVISAYNKGE